MSQDFLVNTLNQAGNQSHPSVSINEQGHYIIAWYGIGSHGQGIYAKKFSIRGEAVGDEFRIPTLGNEISINPSVVLRDDETFILVWQGLRIRSEETSSLSADEVLQRIPTSVVSAASNSNEYFESGSVVRDGFRTYIQIYDSQNKGLPVGIPMQVDPAGIGEQLNPVVSNSSQGTIVVAWEKENFHGQKKEKQIYARLYNSDSSPIVDSFRVDSSSEHSSTNPSVASQENGDFLVAWIEETTGIVYVKKYNRSGVPVTENIQVTTGNSKGYQQHREGGRPVSIAATADNNFAITWIAQADTTSSGGSSSVIYVRLYDSLMQPLMDGAKVDSHNGGNPSKPCIAADKDGNFTVIWEWSDPSVGDAGDAGVFARAYDARGESRSPEYRVNSTEFANFFSVCDGEINPALDMDDDGNFIATWNNSDSVSGDVISDTNVYAKRLTTKVDSDEASSFNFGRDISWISRNFNNSLDIQNALSLFEVSGAFIPLSILSLVKIIHYSHSERKASK